MLNEIAQHRPGTVYRVLQPDTRKARCQERFAKNIVVNTNEAILTQTVEQLESLNTAFSALRRELLPGRPKNFAILPEGPLEDMRRLHDEIERVAMTVASSPVSG